MDWGGCQLGPSEGPSSTHFLVCGLRSCTGCVRREGWARGGGGLERVEGGEAKENFHKGRHPQEQLLEGSWYRPHSFQEGPRPPFQTGEFFLN